MNDENGSEERSAGWGRGAGAVLAVTIAGLATACGGGFSFGTGGSGVFAVVGGGGYYSPLSAGYIYTPDPSASASPTASGSQLTTAEAQGVLDAHNSWRKAVGVPDLVWSTTLASTQQNWMNQLAATSCSLQHNPNSPYGENLFAGTRGYYDVSSAVPSWANEKSLYNGEVITGDNYLRFGHYTQMVWRNTRELGCAKATCGDMLLVGCAYAPQGNVVGEKPY